MSKFYNFEGLPAVYDRNVFGNARLHNRGRNDGPMRALENHFDRNVLFYLGERVINHLFDSLTISGFHSQFQVIINDYSFCTAPAYKAFEGFLFQLAEDLKLPSFGKQKFVGMYFDEEKVDQAIDSLIGELAKKADEEKALNKDEATHIKDMVKEMKRFLVHYRHTPAHFQGEPIDTIQKAEQNILSIYRIINETTKTLLKANLIEIKSELH